MKYEKPYVRFEVRSRKEFSIRTSLSAITEHMPLPLFLCNQSTVINLMHVNWIGEKEVKLRNSEEEEYIFDVPVRKWNELRKQYQVVKANYFSCSHCTDCSNRSICHRPCNSYITDNLIFNNQELVIAEPYVTGRIAYREILSFTSNSPYVKVTTIHKKEKLIRTSLSEIMNYLPFAFFQFNRTEIVNLQHIASLGKKGTTHWAHSKYGSFFPVSRNNVKSFRHKYQIIKKTTTPTPFCLSCKLAHLCTIC